MTNWFTKQVYYESTKLTIKFSFFNLEMLQVPLPLKNIAIETVSLPSFYSSDVLKHNYIAVEESVFLKGYSKWQCPFTDI